MANLVNSLGYSLGKVHTGLIAYLCDLCREGTREPLESLFGALGVRVPVIPVPRREWNSVDLAILEGDTGTPWILVEVKVDDHEGGGAQDDYQTVRYARAWPSCHAFLFVTLGMGEYFHPPRSDRFMWVRIRDLLRALECVKTQHAVVSQWTEEVRREVGLQDAVFRGDRSRLRDYRAGSWNIYFLGRLAEELAPALSAEAIPAEMTCYPYGTRPDTILNFGILNFAPEEAPQYLEINYSGKLHLKVSLGEIPETAWPATVAAAIQKCQMARYDIAPTYHPSGRIGASKTIASFDVGLADDAGALRYLHSPEETRCRLLSVLRAFYGRRDNLVALNPPSGPQAADKRD
jgi:hypothetical protein